MEFLPPAHRESPDPKPVDSWPWIWNDFKTSGYKTVFLEDQPNIGAFQLRFVGFKNKPTDFYGRYYYLLLKHLGFHLKMIKYENLCICERPRHTIYLDYIREFLRLHKHQPFFLLGHNKEYTHADNSLVFLSLLVEFQHTFSNKLSSNT